MATPITGGESKIVYDLAGIARDRYRSVSRYAAMVGLPAINSASSKGIFMGKKLAFLLLFGLSLAAHAAASEAEEQGDLARYKLSIRVTQDAFLQLQRTYGARWRVAMTLDLCGKDDLAQGLHAGDAGNAEVAEAIRIALKKNAAISPTPLTQTESLMVHGAVANLVSSYKIGYKEGTVLALQREAPAGALCAMAVETAAWLNGKAK